MRDLREQGAAQGHEVWDYVEKRGPAPRRCSTSGWCQDCSSIHHFGRFQRLVASKVITREEFERVMHMLRVNGCTIAEWEKHGQDAQKHGNVAQNCAGKSIGMFQWAVDLAGAPAHQTRKVYELFRLLDYDPERCRSGST